jgi:hypothetical protein
MPKRKRDDHGGENEQEDRSEPTRQLRATVDGSIKTLTSSLKLARGLERQKLGRRQKSASNAPMTLLRLREEVIVLKQLDLEKTARNYLIKHLKKVKKVRESPMFERTYGAVAQVDSVKAGAEANVIGRLMNSAPVKQLMPRIMASTYQVLGLEDEKSRENGLRGKKVESKHNDRPLRRSMFVDSVSISDSAPEGSGVDEPGSEPSDIVLEDFEDKLASSSDNESQPSLPDSQQVHASLSREESKKPRMKEPDTFLPSLSMTGYISGSESEEIESTTIKPRKNRRGQRARQQLAELKHGKNARHLKTQDGKAGRNGGWDPKRGAVDDSGYTKGGRNRNLGDRKSSSKPDEGGRSKKATSRDDSGALHPSWEAAKRRKEQPQALAQFSGKKITFD